MAYLITLWGNSKNIKQFIQWSNLLHGFVNFNGMMYIFHCGSGGYTIIIKGGEMRRIVYIWGCEISQPVIIVIKSIRLISIQTYIVKVSPWLRID